MKPVANLTIALGLVLGFACLASAHGGAHETLMGAIHAVVESEMVVVTLDNDKVSVAILPSTRYVTTNDEKGSWTDLKEGLRVSIKLNVHGSSADEVRYWREANPTPDGEVDHE